MFDFHTEMEKIVQDIRSNPDYILLSHFVPPPVSEETITEVEAKLGFSLDEDWKAFFRESNGYQLRWADKKSKKYDPEIVGEPHEGPFDVERVDMDEGTMTGCVNILSLARIFLNTPNFEFGYDEENDFGEMSYSGITRTCKSVESRLHPFDIFHESWNIAVIIQESNLYLVRGNYRFAHYGSYFSDINAFLKLTISTRGDCIQKRKSYAYMEEKEHPPILFCFPS